MYCITVKHIWVIEKSYIIQHVTMIIIQVYTQKGVMLGTPPLSCQSLSTADSLAADSVRSSTESLLQPMSLSRTSPAGMSPRDLKRTNSSSASLGSAETLCDENVPQIPLDGRRDSKSYSSFCYCD